MGGRGASSSIAKGSKAGNKGQDNLEQYLGKRGNPMSIEDSLKSINDWNRGQEYQYNCQSCATSFEATQRGYDVEAVGHGKGKPYFPNADGKQNYWYDVYEGVKPARVGNDAYNKMIDANNIYDKYNYSKKSLSFMGIEGRTKVLNTANQIEKEMKSYGDGSRATLMVAWKGRGNSGHIMNVVNKGGQVFCADSQTGKTFKVSDVLSVAKKGSALTRVDDLKFNSNIQYLTKKKGE